MTILLLISGMLFLVFKIAFFGISAAWGLTKLIFHIVFWPIILVLMIVAGLASFALPFVGFFVILALLFGKKKA